MTFRLQMLSPDDGADVYHMLQEIPSSENGFINSANGLSVDQYRVWLRRCWENSQKTAIEDGWRVPQTTFWFYADDRPVGFGKIRHFLTDKLRTEGGHLGYGISPSERGKGYGKLLLQSLMREAARLGIDSALITVRSENIASIRVAMANGGRIERIDNGRHYIVVPCRTEEESSCVS